MSVMNTGGTSLEERWRAGDETVVGEVLARFRGGLIRKIALKYRGVLSRDDAEEVLLVAICKAWNHRDRFDPRIGTLAALLSRVVDNEAATAVRCGAVQQCYQECSVSSDDLAKIVDPQTNRDCDEQAEGSRSGNEYNLICRAMRALPEKAQRVLWADACSAAETADGHQLAQELGVCETTVRWYRATGRRALAVELLSLGYVDKRAHIGGGRWPGLADYRPGMTENPSGV
jgi:DNA-directed RNA polymerase specialized sigma24 family protein